MAMAYANINTNSEHFTGSKLSSGKGQFRVAQCGMVQSGDRIKLIELRAGSTIVAAAGLWQDTAMYWWIETRNGANWVKTVPGVITAQWFNLNSDGQTEGGAGALLVNGVNIFNQQC